MTGRLRTIAAAALLVLGSAEPSGAPELIWATFLGGSLVDDCDDIAAEGATVWLACHSESRDFPGAARRADEGGGMDAYIVKAETRAGRVVFATRIGGSKYDGAFRIAMDAAGNSYVTGYTESDDLPVTADALQKSAGGNGDGFVVKLDATGRIVYASYIGGSGYDLTTSIAPGEDGTIYVGGASASDDLPGATSRSRWRGKQDGFVMAINLSARRPVRTTYIGGSDDEKLTGLALDRGGNVFVAGYTLSRDLAVRSPYQARMRGKNNAFVAKLDGKTGDVLSATYFGGSMEDSAWGIVVDKKGNPVIGGMTSSSDLPMGEKAFQRKNGGGFDAFAARLNASLSRLLDCTYFGGSNHDFAGFDGGNIGVDGGGRVWLAGLTHSSDMPTRQQVQSSFGGERDGFLAMFSPDLGQLGYASYFGGAGRDLLEGIAVTGTHVFVTGLADNWTIPTSPRPLQRGFGGGDGDAMVLGFRVR
jgi:hypothetical protein